MAWLQVNYIKSLNSITVLMSFLTKDKMSLWSSVSVSGLSCGGHLSVLCCSEGHGKLTVFSMKAMLATMCGGKIVDKLRCKYTCGEGHSLWAAHTRLSSTGRFLLVKIGLFLGPGRAVLPWPFARSSSGEKRTHGGSAGTNIHCFILLCSLTLFLFFVFTLFTILCLPNECLHLA